MADTYGKKIETLPKWAQEYIRDLERERDTAINALFDWAKNKQTESPFYEDDLLCLGPNTTVRHYIQANRVTCESGGVRVEMMPNRNGEGVGIWWDIAEGHRGKKVDAAIRPESNNTMTVMRVVRK